MAYRTVTVLFMLLLGCVVAVQAGFGWEDIKFSSKTADDLQLSEAAVFGENKGWNCTVRCNGKKVENAKDKHYSCWGRLRAFCKAECDKGRAIYAASCEGHFLTFKLKEHNVTVSACEGLTKRFSVKKFEKDGKEFKAVKAAGCLGDAAAALIDHREGKPSKSSAVTAKSPSQLVTDLYPGFFKGKDVEQATPLSGPLKAEGDSYIRVNSECKGLGGKFRGFRESRRGAAAMQEENVDDVEALVNSTMADMSLTLFPHNSFLDLLPSNDYSQAMSRRGGGCCEVLCNGHRPWFKGAPCWGKLTVDCGSRRSKDDGFEGSCKGFFSGCFGARCHGFASAHGSWGPLEYYKYCVGSEAMKFKKTRQGAGAAVFCKGKRFGTKSFDFDEDKSQVQVM